MKEKSQKTFSDDFKIAIRKEIPQTLSRWKMAGQHCFFLCQKLILTSIQLVFGEPNRNSKK